MWMMDGKKWMIILSYYFSGLMVILVAVMILLGSSVTYALGFPVFDALLYQKKPDLSPVGLKPVRMVYDSELWHDGESKDNPNPNTISKIASRLDPAVPVCVDIEHWPTAGAPVEVSSGIDKYISVISAFRHKQSSLKIGYYSVIPRADYWRATKAKGQKAYDSWLKENVALKNIADSVDIIYPSLYTFYPDQKEWVKYAIENIKEAKKYGKPVYAFLWPQYHDSNLIYKGQYIPADFWRVELETCYKYADGIVIWGGWQEKWNENAAWWVETKKFMSSLKRKSN